MRRRGATMGRTRKWIAGVALGLVVGVAGEEGAADQNGGDED
jgi:hypothetical protein